jgi:hypothetical protein
MKRLNHEKHEGLLRSWRYTSPGIHGSWLNMAEIELSVLDRQVLSQRLDSLDLLHHHVQAWQVQRNLSQVKINWRFTTDGARIKLKRLYPSLDD